MKLLILTACLLLISISPIYSEKVTILYHDGTGTIDLHDISTQAEGNRIIYHMLHTILPERYGIDIQLEPVIWARGLELVEAGLADGIINASYTEERAAYAEYPSEMGIPYPGKMLKAVEYNLYRNRNSSIRWDGQTITGLDGDVASVKSYAIINDLEKMNVSVIEEMNIPSIMRNLSIGRYKAAALLPEADLFLADNPSVGRNIIKISPPLKRKEYYLIFSKVFYRGNIELSHRIWDAIGDFQSTDEYAILKAELEN